MLLKIFVLSFALSQAVAIEVRPPSPVDVQPLNVNRPSPCNADSRAYEQNPRGCSWFWECRDGDQSLLEPPLEGICPYNLHFDATRQTCAYYDEVNPRCTFDADNAEAASGECEPWAVMRFLPHPFSCEKYFLCWQNLTIVRDCPPGEHFSLFDNGCVSEFLADCHAADNYCKTFGNLVAKRAPFSCDTYHICTHCNDRFTLTELHCNSETHQFNEDFEHCDVRTNVNCVPAPLDDQPTYLPDELTIVCPDLGIFYHPHPDDHACDFYFLCVDGRSFLQQCEEGTRFDLTRRTCVTSDQVPCPREGPLI